MKKFLFWKEFFLNCQPDCGKRSFDMKKEKKEMSNMFTKGSLLAIWDILTRMLLFTPLCAAIKVWLEMFSGGWYNYNNK